VVERKDLEQAAADFKLLIDSFLEAAVQTGRRFFWKVNQDEDWRNGVTILLRLHPTEPLGGVQATDVGVQFFDNAGPGRPDGVVPLPRSEFERRLQEIQKRLRERKRD
jgi:hypothetical protein